MIECITSNLPPSRVVVIYIDIMCLWACAFWFLLEYQDRPTLFPETNQIWKKQSPRHEMYGHSAHFHLKDYKDQVYAVDVCSMLRRYASHPSNEFRVPKIGPASVGPFGPASVGRIRLRCFRRSIDPNGLGPSLIVLFFPSRMTRYEEERPV